MAAATCMRCDKSANETICPTCDLPMISDEDFSTFEIKSPHLSETLRLPVADREAALKAYIQSIETLLRRPPHAH